MSLFININIELSWSYNKLHSGVFAGRALLVAVSFPALFELLHLFKDKIKD